jgi:T5SS/PEP-CTERM-associated repeat protein
MIFPYTACHALLKIAPGRSTRILFGVAFLFLALSPHRSLAQSLLVDTTFQGGPSSAPGWVLPTGTLQGLTAVTGANGDTDGTGWLRMTSSTVNNQTGFAYLNQAVTLSSGIDVKIQYQTWGGSTTSPYGADGIALDLFSPGNVTPTPGGFGGSLGYAQFKLNPASPLLPGITGGIVGIGIDEHGNFSTNTQQRVGGNATGTPNSITLRGPGTGSGSTGPNGGTSTTDPNYGFIGTKTVNNPFKIQTGAGAGMPLQPRPTGAANLRFAEFKVDTTKLALGLLPVTVTLTNGSGSTPQVMNFDIYAQMATFYGLVNGVPNIPKTFEIGFTSSTGASTNNHEIRNVTVTTVNSDSGSSPIDAGSALVDFVNPGTAAAGTAGNWSNGVAPATTDDVFVNNGGTAVFSVNQTVMRLDTAAGNSGATGGVTIQSGSSLTVTKDVTVGEDGTGTMNVGSTGTGTLTDVNGIIGEFSNSNGTAHGTATVSTGSTWTNSGDLMVAGNLSLLPANGGVAAGAGVGALNVLAGGSVTDVNGIIGEFGIIGTSVASNGTATVSGTGSTWTNSGDLMVAGNLSGGTVGAGTGTLNVLAGGSVTDVNGIIGEFGVIGTSAASNGTATVKGSGSKWTNSGNLTIGQGGTGVLTIGDSVSPGGTVTVGGVVTIARDAGSVGTLNLLTGGVLQVGAASGLAAGSGTANFNFGGGTLQVTSSLFTSAINATLVSSTTSTIDTQSFNAALTGNFTGAGALTKIGSGTLALFGSNTYSGATTVSAGTLQADSATAFSANSAFTDNAALDLHGFSNTVGSLAGSGTVTDSGAAILTAGGNNTNTTFSGNMTQRGGHPRFHQSWLWHDDLVWRQHVQRRDHGERWDAASRFGDGLQCELCLHGDLRSGPCWQQ